MKYPFIMALWLWSTSFSMHRTTPGSYRNGASVQICDWWSSGLLCKPECYIGSRLNSGLKFGEDRGWGWIGWTVSSSISPHGPKAKTDIKKSKGTEFFVTDKQTWSNFFSTLLPSANGVTQLMLSVLSVCLFTGGPHNKGPQATCPL